MDEKRFVIGEYQAYPTLIDNETNRFYPIVGSVRNVGLLCEMLNEQQLIIETLTENKEYWIKSAKLHSKHFNCLEKAIERAYEEKPYPKKDDILKIYLELEKELKK